MKTISFPFHSLLLALAGCLSISVLHAAQVPSYMIIKETKVEFEQEKGAGKIELELKTTGSIPTDGKSGAFGYAALSDGGNNVMVLVTHLPIDDSSYENKTSGFHTHVLDLKAPTNACTGADFEVDLDNSKKNKAFDANYKWKVKTNQIEVEDVPVEDLGDAGVESVVSFTLKPILDANKKPTNLCVTVAK